LAFGVLLSACGSSGGAVKATMTATVTASAQAQAQPTASATPQGPAPLVLPYTFPAAWHAPQNDPTHVGALGAGFAFAPSDPRIGYACSTGASSLSVTHEGGQTWQPMQGTLTASSSYACGAVFVDAHDATDVFVTHGVAANDNPKVTTSVLLRSRDSGATWHGLGQITYQGSPLSYASVTVIGSRLLAAVEIDGEGTLPDALFTSDDGGASWQPGAQSLVRQNLQVGLMATAGDTIFVSAAVPCTGGCGASLPLPLISDRTRPQTAVSSDPGKPMYWRSVDAGNTWMQMSFPGFLDTITRSADGSTYYCTASAFTSSYDQPACYLSRDTCQTWGAVPTVVGAEHGYVTASGNMGALPDGSLIVDAMHNPQDGTHDPDCGIFRLPAGGSSWAPLAPNDASGWLVTGTSSGIRVWGVHPRDPLPLMYLDIAT
jgi:photosystem II stability/assembly factor-like uncharacterized protein